MSPSQTNVCRVADSRNNPCPFRGQAIVLFLILAAGCNFASNLVVSLGWPASETRSEARQIFLVGNEGTGKLRARGWASGRRGAVGFACLGGELYGWGWW